MTTYPIDVDVTSPSHFDRTQLLLRLALSIVLAWIGITAGWLICVLYGVLPLVAAIAISAYGARKYVDDIAPRMWRVLAWLLRLSAFMLLLVDRFPADRTDDVELHARFTARPSVGSALKRFATSIPSGIVLSLLWFVSGMLWIVAIVTVIFANTVPPAIHAFQRGVLRWQARLVAYHASLVDEYPPFTFDTAHHDQWHVATPRMT
jgi:hypothetical protein